MILLTNTHRSSQLTLFFLIVLVIGFVPIVPTGGQSCTALTGTRPAWPRNSTVYVDLGNLNTEQRRQVTAAINSWNQVNQTNGSYVWFSSNAPPTATSFRLNFQLGQTQLNPTTGQVPAAELGTTNGVDGQGNLNRATVTFNTSVQASDQNGNLVQQLNETVSSDSFLKAALHEIGHSMGFGEGQIDTAHPTSGPCASSGQISGSTVMNGMCGANDWGNNMPSSVQPCDNNRISTVSQYQCNLSPTACSPNAFDAPSCLCESGGTGSDPDGCPEHPSSTECASWFICEGCCPCTPILIDVSGNGFALTSAEQGVAFDLNANGVRQGRLSWTAAGSDDAWLVLDRNGNGVVDDGSELFGSFTPQPSPPAGIQKNGFTALAQFDKQTFGGNSDGSISAQDSIFRSLRLWQDVNHDGISQASEIRAIDDVGLTTIDLNYKSAERVDQHGNHFKFRAKVQDVRGQQLGRWAWDVFLVAQ